VDEATAEITASIASVGDRLKRSVSGLLSD
jgi:hypothetical protein